MSLVEGPYYGKVTITGDDINNRVITQPFSLLCTQDEGTETALTYLDVTYNSFYRQHPDAGTDGYGEENEGAFVNGFTIEPEGDTGWFRGTITYTTDTSGVRWQVPALDDWSKMEGKVGEPDGPSNKVEDPTLMYPTLSRSTEKMEVAWTHDMNTGAPLMNSSLQPFVGQTRTIAIQVYTLQWYEADLSRLDQYDSYTNSFNNATWNGFAARHLLFDDVTYTFSQQNGIYIVAYTAIFKRNANWQYINDEWIRPGWKDWIMDVGTRYKNFGIGLGGRYDPIKNAFGELETKRLNGAGSVLSETSNPVFLGFNKYRAQDFSGIFY